MKLTQLFLLILLVPTVSAIPLNEYHVVLDTTENISLQSLDIELKDYADFYYVDAGEYYWKLIAENETVNKSYFDTKDIIYYDYIDPEIGEITDGGMMEVMLDETELFIPYNDYANLLVLYRTENSEKLLEIDLSRFTRFRKVLPPEPTESTSKSSQPPSAEYSPSQNPFYVVGLLFILITVIFFLFIRKKHLML